MAEINEELKRHLVRVKEDREKAGLKLKIKKKTKVMTSSSVTSCQREGEKTGFYFLELQNHCRQ